MFQEDDDDDDNDDIKWEQEPRFKGMKIRQEYEFSIFIVE